MYFDTYLVGRIISDELVLADYKVATVIPHALNFIPICFITIPYFTSMQTADNQCFRFGNLISVRVSGTNKFFRKIQAIYGMFAVAVTRIA